jgi:glycosyltransferase involved in cell wall biosynthesis
MTRVDVAIPCYNYARYLERCVTSVLSQRDVEVRVLIIDDVSPDNTPEIAGRLAKADGRVSYLRNEKNLGLIGTANRGVMEWARSEYVVLLSADDLLSSGSLARATKLMDAHPEVGLTFGMAYMFAENQPELRADDPGDAPFTIVSGRALLRHVSTGSNPVPSPCAVMRTAVQHRIGGYDPAFHHTSDLDMWMRAAAVSSIGIINAIQGFYRWHSSNMSATYHERPVGDRREILQTCRAFEAAHRADFPEFGQWIAALEHRFGFEALVDASKAYERPGTDGWMEALDFAKEYRPDYRSMPAWWKMQAKRLMGRTLAGAVRSAADKLSPSANHAPWYQHGNQIGWWPEPAEAAD